MTGFGQAAGAALEACVAPGPVPSMVITVSPGGTYTRKLWDDLAALTATGSPEPAQAGWIAWLLSMAPLGQAADDRAAAV